MDLLTTVTDFKPQSTITSNKKETDEKQINYHKNKENSKKDQKIHHHHHSSSHNDNKKKKKSNSEKQMNEDSIILVVPKNKKNSKIEPDKGKKKSNGFIPLSSSAIDKAMSKTLLINLKNKVSTPINGNSNVNDKYLDERGKKHQEMLASSINNYMVGNQIEKEEPEEQQALEGDSYAD
jgi:hypothetical protein